MFSLYMKYMPNILYFYTQFIDKKLLFLLNQCNSEIYL